MWNCGRNEQINKEFKNTSSIINGNLIFDKKDGLINGFVIVGYAFGQKQNYIPVSILHENKLQMNKVLKQNYKYTRSKHQKIIFHSWGEEK